MRGVTKGVTMSNQLQVLKTDRSRIECAQQCMRKRFWQYEAQLAETDSANGARGIEPNKPQFALEIGSGVHLGMEVLLTQAIRYQTDPLVNGADNLVKTMILEGTLDIAVRAGDARYDEKILPFFESYNNREEATSNEDDEAETFSVYAVEEGRALVEGLIRTYAHAPNGLARLLDEYEIIAVEQELEVPLSTDGNVVLMARPDGILRSRADHQLYVLSFKTATTYDRRKARAGMYDTQGMSELIAAQHRYNETFAGVVMVYLVKGYKSQDKDDQLWKHNNGVVRPYFKPGVVSDDDDYRFSYDWLTEFGETKRLGKGFSKINLWDSCYIGIKEWMERIVAGREVDLNPDLLDKYVVMPPPYYRNEADLEEWKLQARHQEMLIHDLATTANAMVAAGDSEGLKTFLPIAFPKNRQSCAYPLPCSLIPICHEGLGDGVGEMVLESGSYKQRQANHPNEVEG